MLVDANLLLYARDEASPDHSAAHHWLTGVLGGPRRVGIPWSSVLAFLRIATHPRISAQPLAPAEAWNQVEEWFRSPVAWVPEPTAGHRELLGRYVTGLRLTGNLVPDADLAALAVSHGLELCSADSDFARFPGLRWRNPLTGS